LNAFRERGTGNGEREKREREKRELLAEKKYFWKYEMLPKNQPFKVGRILTVNIYQGQGVGVAAGLAVKSGRPLNGITSGEVRQTLDGLTGLTTYLQGEDTTWGVDYSEIK
jgi:hypothetical protein